VRFDYYAARVEVPPEVLVEQVRKLGHELRPCHGLARSYHYEHGYHVYREGDGVVATVLAGGNGYPFAYASGGWTESFVDLVRTYWPEQHLPTRIDSAEDFNDPNAFDRVRRIGRRLARKHRLHFPSFADDLNPTAGRTQYLGSPKSDYRVRLYEKGWEQVGKLGMRSVPDDFRILNEATGELVRPGDWVRLEGVFRPKDDEARRAAAGASPYEVWGLTAWTSELAKEALALDLERLYIRTRKRTTDEQTLRWMCSQYAAVLQRLRRDVGGWEAVGQTIGKLIEDAKASVRMH
jgi:hypothetical protein